MLSNLSNYTLESGIVLDNNDINKTSRLKIQVRSYFDGLDVELIPWSQPLLTNSITLPAIGHTVRVLFNKENPYFLYWIPNNNNLVFSNESDDDYITFTRLFYKNLANYDDDGEISVHFRLSEGLVLTFRDSKVIIRPDNSIFIQNSNTGHVVHLSEQGISLGSEDKSSEPATLGQTNVDALTRIDQLIVDIEDVLNKGLTNISNIASSNPYTSILSPPIKAMITQLRTLVPKASGENRKFFEETKSNIVNLD